MPLLFSYVLIYFINIDKIIDNIYIYYQNDCCNNESTREQMQVNIEDHIVNNYVIGCNNSTLFITIGMVSVNAICSCDVIIYCLYVLKYIDYFLIQLVRIFNYLLLLVFCFLIAIILYNDIYPLEYTTLTVIESFHLKLRALFGLLTGISSPSYGIVAKSCQSDNKFAAKTIVDAKRCKSWREEILAVKFSCYFYSCCELCDFVISVSFQLMM